MFFFTPSDLCFRWAVALLAMAIFAIPVHAERFPSATREQVLKDISDPDLDIRREAIARLGELGDMRDSSLLLEALRDPDDLTREIADQSIRQLWSRSGDPKVDALFNQGVQELRRGSLKDSIAIFSDAIDRAPGFAEAWNRRATAYLIAGEYERALRDCYEAIRRNPYHFGALANYGQIYYKLEQPERALEYFRKALAINPNLEGLEEVVEHLERVINRKRKRMI